MRMPCITALSVVASASAAFAQSPSRPEGEERSASRCAPQVEATATVAAATVARLTVALSSGSSPVAGACPRVRLDVVNARLVMTVVLEDGRQVARVLTTQQDALPTLVALTATLAIPVDDDTVETPASVPAEAPRPDAPTAVVVEVPTLVMQPPAVPGPVTSRGFSLRLAASLGTARSGSRVSPQGGLGLDLLFPRWAFGLEGSYARAPRHGASSEGFSASVRWRRGGGRWQFEIGPALGLTRTSVSGADARFGMRAGGVTSLGFLLLPSVSIFARVEAGTERSAGRGSQSRDRNDTMNPYYTASIGLRWEFLR